jgi:hypothetical protein
MAPGKGTGRRGTIRLHLTACAADISEEGVAAVRHLTAGVTFTRGGGAALMLLAVLALALPAAGAPPCTRVDLGLDLAAHSVIVTGRIVEVVDLSPGQHLADSTVYGSGGTEADRARYRVILNVVEVLQYEPCLASGPPRVLTFTYRGGGARLPAGQAHTSDPAADDLEGLQQATWAPAEGLIGAFLFLCQDGDLILNKYWAESACVDRLRLALAGGSPAP